MSLNLIDSTPIPLPLSAYTLLYHDHVHSLSSVPVTAIPSDSEKNENIAKKRNPKHSQTITRQIAENHPSTHNQQTELNLSGRTAEYIAFCVIGMYNFLIPINLLSMIPSHYLLHIIVSHLKVRILAYGDPAMSLLL
jgi:hypothetical protein